MIEEFGSPTFLLLAMQNTPLQTLKSTCTRNENELVKDGETVQEAFDRHIGDDQSCLNSFLCFSKSLFYHIESEEASSTDLVINVEQGAKDRESTQFSGVIACGSGAAQPQSQVGQQQGEVNAEELQEEGQETKDQETDVDQLQSNLPILTDGDQSQVDHNDDNTICCLADCCSNYQQIADKAFSTSCFNNWKKAIEKFKCHVSSLAHKEACVKWHDQEGDDFVKSFLKENRFTSYQVVNEIITLAYSEVLKCIKSVNGSTWFSVIADKATDVASNEQMSIAIRWVNDKYEGIRSGVATRFCSEVPAALSVHCFAHNLHLCLQNASKKLVYIRDSLITVREISNLIRYSPKRLHLFSNKLDNSYEGVTLKPLCPTRWTARTAALEAVLKDYEVLTETQEEIHESTHDEYGMKAGGLLQSLEKFSTYFGIKLCHLLFNAAEQVSSTLQRKDITLSEALTAVESAKSYYQRIRLDDTFMKFYCSILTEAQSYNIKSPELPRYRKHLARYLSGTDQHRYSSPKEYHRHQFYEACELLYGELVTTFDSELVSPVLSIEEMLVSAANNEPFDNYLKSFGESPFKDDVSISDLKKHLLMLPDVALRALPEVKTVTSIRTICDTMNSSKSYQDMLSSVHLLFMTISNISNYFRNI
uniref:Uncharacterized protein n=1 Tax=Amphimedon queenslandica TaxID=400682 RepID=A0A1X7TXD7_AMPQE